jgi:AAA+ ATPase superfamily predicted ATPase
METSANRPFVLVIDEFQEFFKINKSIFSDMQNIWDRNKNKTHINLVLCGSAYTLMHKIFQDKKEPLFGRADNTIKLSRFSTGTIKTILSDYRTEYSNDDLLALYTFTGGIPKYIELFCDSNITTVSDMIDFMIRDNSLFIYEGKNLLIEEFGKNYDAYFSIISAISGGVLTQSEIESLLGGQSIGGHIKRLVEDYEIIKRKSPIGSKPGSHAVRYEISDNFLTFWFRYLYRHDNMVEIKAFDALRHIVKEDYNRYSGVMLERYYRAKLVESGDYQEIGTYWESKGEQNEIDIVALYVTDQKADIIEVKRNRSKYNEQFVMAKAEHLRKKQYNKYEMCCKCLSLEDM